jgi:RNA polymerase sigma factor (sigma-70 family)
MTLTTFLERLEQEGSKVLEDVQKECRHACVRWLVKHDKHRDIEAAKDIFAEVLLILWHNAERGRIKPSSTQVQTYLITICRNTQINMGKRKGKPSEWVFDDLLSQFEAENPDAALEKEALLTRVEDTLARMKEGCQTLFNLRYWEGKSNGEIADILGYASAHVVKTLIHNCKAKFKDLFGNLF